MKMILFMSDGGKHPVDTEHSLADIAKLIQKKKVEVSEGTGNVINWGLVGVAVKLQLEEGKNGSEDKKTILRTNKKTQ